MSTIVYALRTRYRLPSINILHNPAICAENFATTAMRKKRKIRQSVNFLRSAKKLLTSIQVVKQLLCYCYLTIKQRRVH